MRFSESWDMSAIRLCDNRRMCFLLFTSQRFAMLTVKMTNSTNNTADTIVPAMMCFPCGMSAKPNSTSAVVLLAYALVCVGV